MKLAAFFVCVNKIILYLCPAKVLNCNALIQCPYSLTHFSPVSHFYTPGKRQGVQKCDTGLKWVKNSYFINPADYFNTFPELYKARVTSVYEIPVFIFTLIIYSKKPLENIDKNVYKKS